MDEGIEEWLNAKVGEGGGEEDRGDFSIEEVFFREDVSGEVEKF